MDENREPRWESKYKRREIRNKIVRKRERKQKTVGKSIESGDKGEISEERGNGSSKETNKVGIHKILAREVKIMREQANNDYLYIFHSTTFGHMYIHIFI